LRFVTMHAFDRRKDGQTEISSQDCVCIPCSTVKPNQMGCNFVLFHFIAGLLYNILFYVCGRL